MLPVLNRNSICVINCGSPVNVVPNFTATITFNSFVKKSQEQVWYAFLPTKLRLEHVNQISKSLMRLYILYVLSIQDIQFV